MNLKKTILLVPVILALVAANAYKSIAQDNAQEYILKAAFIYRFTDYVEWNNNSSDVFSIAVIGESGITPQLLELARGKKIKNKRIVIREFESVNELDEQGGVGSFQIIFVSRNFTQGIENITSKIGEQPVLVIAEQRNAVEKGSSINFFISNNKLKFEVNMKAVTKAGLKISSQLLQHAIIIN